MMTHTFCFMLKALYVEIFVFFSRIFGYVEKHPNEKVNVNSKIFGIKDCTTNNYNTHIAQYLVQ